MLQISQNLSADSFEMLSKTSAELDESNLLLPSVIDLRAQTEPDRLFCILLNSANIQDGLVHVSYSDYANAINRCSWWLGEKLGKGNSSESKTIGYFGPSDIRQTIVALAVAKINHKVNNGDTMNLSRLIQFIDLVAISKKLCQRHTQIA